MIDVLQSLAMLTSAAGVIVLLVGFATTLAWRAAFANALDLWLAAGLLWLSEVPSWPRLATAALVLFVRALTSFGMRTAGRRRWQFRAR